MLVDPRRLVTVAEIEKRNQLLAPVIPADSEHMVIVRLNQPNIRPAVEGGVFAADFLELFNCREHLALPRRLILPERGILPIHTAAVQVAAVILLQRIIMIRIVIELRDLIARIQHRNAALREKKRVQHDIEF